MFSRSTQRDVESSFLVINKVYDYDRRKIRRNVEKII